MNTIVEKRLEAGLDATIQRVKDLNQAIQNMILRLEYEHEKLDWKDVLADYSHINGQLALLGRVLKTDKLPNIENQVVLPIHLNPDEDPQLLQLTEGRLHMFDHQFAPEYLRTKLEPEAELSLNQHKAKEALMDENLPEEIFKKSCVQAAKIQNILQKSRDNLDAEYAQKFTMKTATLQDTHNLLACVVNGKGFRRPPPSPQPVKASSISPSINPAKTAPIPLSALPNNIQLNIIKNGAQTNTNIVKNATQVTPNIIIKNGTQVTPNIIKNVTQVSPNIIIKNGVQVTPNMIKSGVQVTPTIIKGGVQVTPTIIKGGVQVAPNTPTTSVNSVQNRPAIKTNIITQPHHHPYRRQ